MYKYDDTFLMHLHFSGMKNILIEEFFKNSNLTLILFKTDQLNLPSFAPNIQIDLIYKHFSKIYEYITSKVYASIKIFNEDQDTE